MRNLKLYSVEKIEVSGDLQNATSTFKFKNSIYAVIEGFVYRYSSEDTERFCVSNEHKCITDVVFLVFEEVIWFGTGKSFVIYTPKTESVDVIEFNEAFAAAEWSPTQDTLVVVSTTGNISVISLSVKGKSFKCIESCRISDPVVQKFTVGWGSKENQFRGPRKHWQTSETEEFSQPITDTVPQIVWREDQEYFLVNYFFEGKRRFKVFKYPCTPYFENEDLPGLQAPIAWRCVGNMIACPVWTNNIKISIFEKNGLLRHSFRLCKQESVKKLKWNRTGDILAIQQKSATNEHYISLYTMSNFKWYLKQCFTYTDNSLIMFDWIELTDTFSLIVSTSKGILQYKFIQNVNRGTRNTVNEGVIVSIDGENSIINDFARAITPPPLGLGQDVQTFNPVNHVVFHPTLKQFMLIDSKYHCHVIELQDDVIKNVNEFDLTMPDDLNACFLILCNFVWYSHDKMAAVGLISNKCSILLKYDVLSTPGSILSQDYIEKNVNYMTYVTETQELLILSSGNTVCVGDQQIVKGVSLEIVHVEYVIVTSVSYIFYMTTTNQFYINNTLICDDVTSMLIHGQYLLLTTLDNKLYCVQLQAVEIENAISRGSLRDCYSRPIEKGGLLVGAKPNDIDVILQMPRGNLEVNICRLMVIDKLEKLLDFHKWNDAFELIQMQKLNSNLLVDLNAERFLENIEQFLTEIKSNVIIVNFLLELVEENVLETLYKNCHVATCFTNKVFSVCKKVAETAQRLDSAYYVRSIVIARIKLDGPEFALDFLHYLFKQVDDNHDIIIDGLNALKLHYPSSDLTVPALMTYDTNFIKFIYENSSNDPLFYTNLLSTLHSESYDEKCFKINDYLRRYDTAVIYLAIHTSNGDNGNISHLLNYAQKHNVLQKLYEFSLYRDKLVQEVSKSYAEYLSDCELYEEAAMIFEHAGYLKEALEEYKLCNKWKDALSLIQVLDLSEIEKNEHYHNIAQNLVTKNDLKNAAFLYEVYICDCSLAVRVLLNGYQFAEAVRIALKWKRSDLIESDIKPIIIEYTENLLEKLQSSSDLYKRHLQRLQVIRKSKVSIHEDFSTKNGTELLRFEKGYAESIASGISTLRSVRSKASGLSSRSRRKEDLRKEDLRVGGYYEDIALMKSLKQLIEEIYTLEPDIQELCQLIFKYKAFNNSLLKAKLLYKSLQDVYKDIRMNIPIIWPSDLNLFNATQTPELLASRQNLDHLDMKFRVPPSLPNSKLDSNIFSS